MEYFLLKEISDTTEIKTNNLTLYKTLEYWMTDLPLTLKKIPLIQIAIPGK